MKAANSPQNKWEAEEFLVISSSFNQINLYSSTVDMSTGTIYQPGEGGIRSGIHFPGILKVNGPLESQQELHFGRSNIYASALSFTQVLFELLTGKCALTSIVTEEDEETDLVRLITPITHKHD